MRPHIVSRVILREFRIGAESDSSVLVMNLSTKEIRPRGINHNSFLGEANYLGDGQSGTLENEMACKDENSIKTIINLARQDQDMTEHLPQIKYFLGNNAARSPHFRKHPKVSEWNIESSEQFHTSAMDIFPDHYINYPIALIHIKSPKLALILPDFSLTHAVLAPDVVIVRLNETDCSSILGIAAIEEDRFVRSLNYKSLQQSQNWVVANSMTLLEGLGGFNGSRCSCQFPKKEKKGTLPRLKGK